MTDPKVKICGVTSVADGRLALELGADLLGLNFYPPSPRYLPRDRAAALLAGLPAETVGVGLFVDATMDEIAATLETCPLPYVQLHGAETPAFCRQVAALGVTVIKALRLRGREDVARLADYDTPYLLVDAFRPDLYGGTGETFDWSWLAGADRRRLFLAGGITPDNVAAAAAVDVYALDLCSGVESAPGVKDPDKLRRLFENLRGRS